MPFPSGTPVITLTGTLPKAVGGTGFTGRIILTPSAVLTDATHKAVYPGGGPVDFDTNGAFTVQVIPTDAAGILPAGWKWLVDIQPAGGHRVVFWTDISTSAGPTVDLSTLVPTTAPDGTGQSLPPSGPAGGDLSGSYPNPQVIVTHLASPLPITQGGTGSATQSFVDLATDQTIAGNKTFSFYTVLQGGQVNGEFHLLGTVGFFGAAVVGRQTVAGAKGGNAALASLITALANLGLITDNTTA